MPKIINIDSYHEEYRKRYPIEQTTNDHFLNHQKENNIKNIYKAKINISYSTIAFLALPFVFSIVLNVFFIGKYNNHYEEFSNEITEDISEKKSLSLTSNKEIENIFLKDLNYDSEEKKISYRFLNDTIREYQDNLQDLEDSFKQASISNNKIKLPQDLSTKKEKFINLVLPIAIYENQKIIAQRQRLNEIKNFLNSNKTLDKSSQKFVLDLAKKYLIQTKNKHKVDVINELLISVDIIPNSIVIAQAANESGWGSSRFATEYNALFGEYTFDKNIGIIPSEREKGKKHLIKFFSSIDKSVESYFKNINTHRAYKKFREVRNNLREKQNFLDVTLLINELQVYAEDAKYVETIRLIIEKNKLQNYDNNQSFL